MDAGQKASMSTEESKVFRALKRNNTFHLIVAKSPVLPHLLWALGQSTVLKVLSVMEAI